MKVTESQKKIIQILRSNLPFLFFEEEENHSIRIINKNVLIAKINVKERGWHYTIFNFEKPNFLYFKGKGWHKKIVDDFSRSVLFEVDGEDSYYKVSCRLADLYELLVLSVPNDNLSVLRYGAFTITGLKGANGPANLFVSLSRSISIVSKVNIFEMLDYFKDDQTLDEFRKIFAFNIDLMHYFSLWHYDKVD